MPESPSFVFVTCQIGAEPALKHELATEFPALRFAFSRPGFLTFKLSPGVKLRYDFASKLVFARAAGFCLGKVSAGATPNERADAVWKLFEDSPVTQLHVWPRDRYTPGYRDYEPGMTSEAAEIEALIRQRKPESGLPSSDEFIADVIIVDDDEWWVGYHRGHSLVSTWPGGFFQPTLPTGIVSRAYLKMQEAVLWSGFRLKAGERCVEIGAAPGGASQLLLAQGLDVVGIDPAMIDTIVTANPRFRQIRMRSKEVPRREFIGVDWLTCDINLPPNYALDAVKAIVIHPGVKFQGMLLTLKLVEWSLAGEIPKYLERIRSWGFRNLRARQLHNNRQEICVAASGFRSTPEKKLLPEKTTVD